jgi:hypothetical protein
MLSIRDLQQLNKFDLPLAARPLHVTGLRLPGGLLIHGLLAWPGPYNTLHAKGYGIIAVLESPRPRQLHSYRNYRV